MDGAIDIVRYGIIECDNHTGGTATCTSKAVCDICGQEYGSLLDHKLIRNEAKEPTLDSAGNIEYWYCEYCDKYYKGALGTNELSLEDITIPKLSDHTPSDTWYYDEKSHWHTCECGEVLDKEVHDFKWVIDKEATTTSEGLKHEECTVCGYKKEAVSIPVLEIEVPDTGVRSNTSIFTAIALLSLSALTGSVIYQRKKKEN